MRRGPAVVAGCLAVLLGLPCQAALEAWLDADRIDRGETVQLTLRRQGQPDSDPDLTPLQADFDILASSRGSTVEIVNGRVAARTDLRLTLAPKVTGSVQVPAIEWGGEHSPALRLAVGAEDAGDDAGQAGPPPVFLETEVEPTGPYLQQAVSLTVRLYAAVPLYQASLQLPASNDVLIQRLGEDRQREESRGGRSYRVVEREYLIFPQRSGELHLPGPLLDAQVPAPRKRRDRRPTDPATDPFFRGFFGRSPLAGVLNETRPLRLRGEAMALAVRARPDGVGGQYWLPARQLALEEAWSPDNLEARVGEPLTRRLHLKAEGLTAAQLPDLAVLARAPDGLKAYPDPAAMDTAVVGDSAVGSRQQDIALVAERPGTFRLPPIRIEWWDVVADVAREAVLPGRTLRILPVPSAAPEPTVEARSAPLREQATGPVSAKAADAAPATEPAGVASRSGDHTVWSSVSLVLGLLWLATFAAWWHERRVRRVAAEATPSTARTSRVAGNPVTFRRAFQHACQNDDPRGARHALLEWGRACWPEAPPLGLSALGRRFDDPQMGELLKELDRACYGGGGWRGATLASALRELPAGKTGPVPGCEQLAPLYP